MVRSRRGEKSVLISIIAPARQHATDAAVHGVAYPLSASRSTDAALSLSPLFILSFLFFAARAPSLFASDSSASSASMSSLLAHPCLRKLLFCRARRSEFTFPSPEKSPEASASPEKSASLEKSPEKSASPQKSPTVAVNAEVTSRNAAEKKREREIEREREREREKNSAFELYPVKVRPYSLCDF